ASLHGVCVRGPTVGKEHAFVLVRDWLGEGAAVDPRPAVRAKGRLREREAALAELARRYLVGHGPATDADLARWAGLPLRDARAGFAAISRRLVDLGNGLVDLGGREE